MKSRRLFSLHGCSLVRVGHKRKGPPGSLRVALDAFAGFQLVDASRAFPGERLVALGTFDLRRGDECRYGNSRHEPAMIDAPNLSWARLAPIDGRHVHREGHQLENILRVHRPRVKVRDRDAQICALAFKQVESVLCHHRDSNPEPPDLESRASTSWTMMAWCRRVDSNHQRPRSERGASTKVGLRRLR